ncbi:MAG: hypothetical protein ACK5LZ_06120 [Anaerorhabdus sp.]
MARKTSYNYTLAINHKRSYYIPLVGIEVNGLGYLIISVLYLIIGTLIIGVLLNLIFNDIVVYGIALGINLVVIMWVFALKDKVQHFEGSNALFVFYAKYIKKYRVIITDTGEKVYLSPRKGVKIECVRM